MSDNSRIEWTDATWNPVTGCNKVSAGCANCYAETFAERWRGIPGHPYEQGFDLRTWPQRLELPLQWKEPRKIFVNSMSDLFHNKVADKFVEQVFSTMFKADWHTYQVLTKRADRLLEFTSERYFRTRAEKGKLKLPENIWLGVSVENERVLERVERLVEVPAQVRFLSVEPLLGPLQIPQRLLKKLQWVIVGGESGPHARPMDPEWALSIKEQCKRAGVPFFFKQWGAFDEEGERVGKKAAGRELAGKTWNEMPKVLVAA